MAKNNDVVLVFNDGSRMEINLPGKRLFRVETSAGNIAIFGPAAPPLPRGVGLRILLDQPIEELELSVRATNALSGIELDCFQIGQVVQLTEAQLLKTKGIRRVVLTQVKEALAGLRLSLGMLPEDLDGWKPRK